MKKAIRIVSLIIIISILSVQIAFSEEATPLEFSDLDESFWAYESIQKLIDAGIISGYPDGTFRPEGYITRAELVKITNMVFSYTNNSEASEFNDISLTDWFYDNVLIAKAAGYINGYPDGTFKPNDNITRQELCKIIDAINNLVELPLDSSPADEVSPWAVGYVSRVISNRIMTADSNNNFRATEKATRAEVCEVLAKFLLEEPIDEEQIGGGSGSDGEIKQEDLYNTMDRVIDELSTDVINNLTTDDQKEIINDIIYNMNAYQADNTHDYEAAAEDTFEKYKQLSEEEREALKYEVQIRNSTRDLLILQDFFFPDVEL